MCFLTRLEMYLLIIQEPSRSLVDLVMGSSGKKYSAKNSEVSSKSLGVNSLKVSPNSLNLSVDIFIFFPRGHEICPVFVFLMDV